MLTELQEKILKRLIDALPKSVSESIVLSDLDELPFVYNAVKELSIGGYLMDRSTLLEPKAIITDKGRGYFQKQMIEKYGEAIMQKIELIDKYINEASDTIETRNLDLIYEKVEEIVGIYELEIKDIRGNLKAYGMASPTGTNAFFNIMQPLKKDYSSDLRLLMRKLENLRTDILSKAEEKRSK